ncbi:uncharacterized protein LOC136070776 [Quercus suber]|uniref:uncharacterized protein LOC136070776 n=1 Tax=Quercus suber TaxID=58331 RepID=UPI0032DEE59B
MFNEMEDDCDGVALNTFKLGLPTEHGLRKSLIGKPVTNVRQLMDHIDKYKRVEEDQQQGKEKNKVIPQEMRDFRSNRYGNNKQRRDFSGQSGSTNLQVVNVVFKKPVHQVFEKIKNEPFFKWLNKMVGNLKRHNHNLYCQYHQDHEHTTEDCRSLWDHLDQLVCKGRLKQLLHHSSSRGGDFSHGPKRVKSDIKLVLEFSDEDKVGTIQPHNDALVITLKIGRYNVKRIMVDQGSAVEIMYPNLYRGLNLKPDDLEPYNSPLEKEELTEFLKRNLDIFTWNAYEALGVDLEFICRHLKVNPLITPKKQPHRRPSKEHADVVREEVTKLKQAGDI